MPFEIPKQPYSGAIGEVTIGSGDGAVTVGGEDSYPFHLFEGNMPNPPKIAMEIWDYDPSAEWPAPAVEPFKDVISSPHAWAKKCVEEFGADMIVLQLKSTDPNGQDRTADEAAAVAKKVIGAVKVPVILWGTANNQKDEDVLKKISESNEDKNLGLAPVEEGNHKGVGASAMGYGHTVVASSPIDVNLAKQLNILLGNLGLPLNKVIIDPTTGGLGYGLEYSYSVMERIRMAALTQEDDKLQAPMISNVGNEVWKCKEAGQDIEEAPTLGDPEKRAILMETTAAVCYLMSGADVVILRHPESVRLTRAFIGLMINGGTASEVARLSKSLDMQEADLLAISPQPNLDFGEPEQTAEKKPAKAKKKEAKAAPAPEKKSEEKPAPKPEAKEKVVDLKPKGEPKLKEEAAKPSPEEDARAKAEAEARAKAEAEARAKAEAEAKARAEAEVKARAEAEVKAKAREKEDLQALRRKRAQEKEQQAKARKKEDVPKAAQPGELDLVDRLILGLERWHKR